MKEDDSVWLYINALYFLNAITYTLLCKQKLNYIMSLSEWVPQQERVNWEFKGKKRLVERQTIWKLGAAMIDHICICSGTGKNKKRLMHDNLGCYNMA